MKNGRELRSEECASSSAGEIARKEKAVGSVTMNSPEKVMEQTGRANGVSIHGNVGIGSARHAETTNSVKTSIAKCAIEEEYILTDHSEIIPKLSRNHQRSKGGLRNRRSMRQWC